MTARVISDPQPGFFTVRLVRGGPLVPAVIWRPCKIEIDEFEGCVQPLDRWPHLRAQILNRDVHPETVWAAGRAVPMAEWQYLTARAEWARAWSPRDPLANPKHPVAIEAMEPAF